MLQMLLLGVSPSAVSYADKAGMAELSQAAAIFKDVALTNTCF